MSAFRLPSACLKEVEKLCSAFLWSGPELNGKKAKVSWGEICKPKQEGGLGVKRLKEVNLVCSLKLLWRILSANTLWVNWIQTYLIRKGSIWSVKDSTQTGSWMWRKILKCREVAKQMYRVEVKNGRKTSFWYESWSSLGCLKDLLCDRGYIDMGVSIDARVAECSRHRKRHHRFPIFNRVEEEIERFKTSVTEEEDVSLWRNSKGVYKKSFLSKETWQVIREKHLSCFWSRMVWFKHATPKFSFILWMAMKERLTTGERMSRWGGNVDTACVFCQDPFETLAHLFFECPYSSQIWEVLMKGVMGIRYTSNWRSITRAALDNTQGKIKLFVVRYVLQAAVHTVWRERNMRRHGESPSPGSLLVKLIDKIMRNKLSIIRKRGDKEYEGGMVYWFSTK